MSLVLGYRSRGPARNARAARTAGLLTAVLAALFLLGGPTYSADPPITYTVAPGAADAPGSCNAANECTTLRAAVAEATSGDTIQLFAGLYPISGQLQPKAGVTIVGAAQPPGPGASTIQVSGNNNRAFSIANGAATTIQGVFITGGSVNQTGGAILVAKNATLNLKDSTLAGNRAREGGAIDNQGTLNLSSSTIANNVASNGKGGGVLSGGTLTAVNSTVTGNSASQGGGLSVSGTATLNHLTIAGNSSTNQPGGGIQRNGGTIVVRHSIIANNSAQSGDGRDCSGTPSLVDGNLVSVLLGCNPVGPVVVGDPLLGPLAANGGATETLALGEGSPAIDGYEAAGGQCSQPVDQRGVARPGGDGCDFGAWEDAPVPPVVIELDISLTAPATVPVGVRSVPASAAFGELDGGLPGGPSSTGLASIGLASIGLASITLQDTGLASIGLASIGLASIGLASIPLETAGLASIGLASILVSDTPLLLPGGWEAFLAGTIYEGVPLQTLTLADILALYSQYPHLPDITLAQLDISSTGLASIGLASILLHDVGLASIPLPCASDSSTCEDSVDAWCELLGPEICSLILSNPNFSLLSLDFIDAEKPLIPLGDIPLDETAGSLQTAGLASIGLASIQLQNTGLASIGLASIGLASIQALNGLIDCSTAGVDCSETSTQTLGDAVALGALWPSCTGAASTDLQGCLWNLLELANYGLLDGYSLADLLLAFLAPGDLPWETLDLENSLLQNIADPQEPPFYYTVALTVEGGVAAAIDVFLELPAGFAFAANLPLGANDPRCKPSPCAASLLEAPATFDGSPVAETSGGLSDLTFRLEDVQPGDHELRIAVRAGLVLGPATASASAAVPTPDGDGPSAGPVTATVTVVEATQVAAPAVISFSDLDGIQLSHISHGSDIDLYRLDLPAACTGASTVGCLPAGAFARILLSNLPADYDLTLFSPARESLRGPATRTIAAVDDYQVGLTPGIDTFATDVVQDIPFALPAPGTVVSAVSSRRGTAAEEIISSTLIPGGTYYIQVSSYNGALSAHPYALRVKLQHGPSLGACTADPRFQGLPAVSFSPQADAAVNTLFITNLSWLQATLGAVPADDVLAAIGELNGVAGVQGVVVPVDAYPAVWNAYQDWDNDRCDPEARNDTVRAIGSVLDALTVGPGAPYPNVQNLVIVGDDGIVPMAAVADATSVSNERAYAAQFQGHNELVAALANGMLLTDAPFGNPEVIAVRDRYLYMPTLAVGRLVETADEMLVTLNNFVAYDGQLDPSSAAVTGYDFLTDGAQAVAAALAAHGYPVDQSLITNNWTSAELAAVIATNPGLFSPNAHYDWEDLLPANSDALGTTADLFNVADFLANHLSGAIVFTMGCHAGLSVSDVSLGISATDWAQAYLGKGNVFAGHTTYGYGDTDIVALSERLVAIYAGKLGAMSAGDALLYARHQYLGTTPVLNPYDEKILQSMTFYGLPMFAAGEPGVVGAGLPSGFQSLGVTAQVQAQVANAGVTFGLNGKLVIDLQLGTTSGPATLHRVDGAEGSYYEIDGQTFEVQFRPIQPRVDVDVTGSNAAGFLITSLTSQDIFDFEPLYFRPRVDLGEHEPRITPGDASFPSNLASISSYLTPAGPALNLMVIPGQYQASEGIQRLFTSIGGELTTRPAGSTDTTPARIVESIGRVGDGVAAFEIHTDTTARRVYVLFKEGGSAEAPRTWRGVELVEGSPGVWVGGDLLTSDSTVVEFIVQAVDDAGNVSMSNNKAEDFLAAEPFEFGDITIDVDGPNVNGYYTGPVTATITSPATGLKYSLDGQPFVAYTGAVAITGSGGHTIMAIDDDGGIEFRFFVIDQDPPIITATISTPAGSPPSATVQIDALDVGPSGVASISYYLVDANGVATTPVTILSDTTTFSITQPGTWTVHASATDVAGNTSAVSAVGQTSFYGVCLQYDPHSPSRVGSTVPIRLQLCDHAGNNLSSPQLTLLAVTVDGTLDPGPNDAGNANTGYEFRFSAQRYIYNLKTDGLGVGPHTLDFIVLDGTNGHCASLPRQEIKACTVVYHAPFTLN